MGNDAEYILHGLRHEYDSISSEIVLLRDEIKKLRAELALAQKWRDNYKLAYERAIGEKVRGE